MSRARDSDKSEAKCWTIDGWKAVIEDALPRFSDIVLPVGGDVEFEAVSAMTEGLPVRILNQASLNDVAFEISNAAQWFRLTLVLRMLLMH